MEEEGIIYPEVGDTLIDHTKGKILSTGWFAGDWEAFPFAYKSAADALVDGLDVHRGDHTVVPDDKFVFPILFLYRHFVELQLKSLVVQLDNFTQEPIKSLITHNLLLLWKHIKANLHHLSHSTVDLNGIDALDQLIGELDCLDASSFSFRYPTDTNLSPVRVPRSLSMDNLKEVMTAIGNSLNLIAEALDNEKSYWYAENEDWTNDDEASIVPWNNFVYY